MEPKVFAEAEGDADDAGDAVAAPGDAEMPEDAPRGNEVTVPAATSITTAGRSGQAMETLGRGCLILIAIGGAGLALVQWFVGQFYFAPVGCSSPSCVENRGWSGIAALGSGLAVFCVFLAIFRVVWPVPLLAVAAAAFGFAAVTAVRPGFEITPIIGAVLAVSTAVLAGLQWRTPLR